MKNLHKTRVRRVKTNNNRTTAATYYKLLSTKYECFSVVLDKFNEIKRNPAYTFDIY